MAQYAHAHAGVAALGMMGGGADRHALASGYQVYGYDVLEAAMAPFRTAGGLAANSPAEVAQRCPVVLTSLPSSRAFRDVRPAGAGPASAGADQASRD